MSAKRSIRLTRREMLKLSGALAAGSVLAACAPAEPEQVEVTREVAVEQTVEVPVEQTVVIEATEAPEPTVAPLLSGPVEGKVVVMHNRAQFSEEQEAQFEADNAGVTIEFLQSDMTRFFAMYAAGTPPDMLRTQAPAIPQFLARGMLYDLTPYFEVSDVLSLDDLAPANDYYRAYGPLEIGDGPIYGMCKDWSPDFTMFAYKPAFEEAGLDVPDDTTHLTYQEVLDLARQLAKFEGDRVLTWGYGYDGAWTDRMWMNMLAELDQSLYTEGFSTINLASSEEASAVAKYYFDLTSENLCANPLNPSPSWIGEDFTKGTLALCQYGYWFSAMAESDVTAGQVVMIPTATWAGVPRDPTMTATGSVVAAATKVPDAAWKVFEWYNGKEPALARAGSGWGVPALKSMYELMPSETEYQQQVQRVLQAELDLATPALQFNPFISEGIVFDSWTKNLEQALMGTITFDECLANVEAEVNTAIKNGIDRLS
jgi:multiple sugar transport system substrate-binding protein